jgi:hypothetical protein
MVRLPVVAENWLADDQPQDQQTIGPADGGGDAGAAPKNPIGPVRGYPEDGKHAWRAANDDAIVEAAKKYNSDNQRFPGDSDYMTPKLMKAWMMRESGGTPEAFQRDPFQVNNGADWDDAKRRIAGLSEGQAMTPQTSAEAALRWLQYKGRINPDHPNRLGPYQGHYEALRNYNAASGSIDGIPKKSEYANDVMNRAWASYGDWQR